MDRVCASRCRMLSLSRHGVHTRPFLSSAPLLFESRVAPCCRPRHYVRTYAAIPSTSLKPTHSIYVSNSTNPYFNLTFEDWCVPLFSIVAQKSRPRAGSSASTHQRLRSCFCTETHPVSSSDGTRTPGKRSTLLHHKQEVSLGSDDAAAVELYTMYVSALTFSSR